ncbi:MAG: cytochrome b/b6 domain-containing protein [Ignavibacteriales bacterium]|nr:cytochrome b/b6 domain-containing protein [Ignavibacteriales bacterium]
MALKSSSSEKLRCFPNILKNIQTLLVIGLVILPQYIYAQSIDDCLMCHSDNELTMEKKGKEISLFVKEDVYKNSAHSKLSCVACHKGFDAEAMPHAENIKEVNCVSCHQKDLTNHAFHPQIIKSKGFGKTNDTSCKGCHGIHDVVSPKNPKSKWNNANLIVTCGNCHKDASEFYLNSDHGIAFKSGDKNAPNCITCHKSPITEKAFVNNKVDKKIAQEKLCLSCHLDNEDVRQRSTPSTGFIHAYENSVHGFALHKNGNGEAATCVDCHKAHFVVKGTDSRSTVYRLNIQNTCGACHVEVKKEFEESIHGQLVAKGNGDAPSCTNCHGEHNILKTNDPNSPVAFQNVSRQICSPCHESMKLSEKYGMSANRYKTFSESYHGLALSGGSASVANCGSCHGVHNIKPSSDPTSMVHKDNLVKTCGSCHPGANETFTQGNIHVTLDKEDEPILYWISTTYIVLLISVLGGMFLHNLLDLIKKSKIRKLKQIGQIKEEKHGHSLYLRMTVGERIQHATMAISFMILVVTGFMLRYPDSWWVSHIRDFWTDVVEYRSWIHRIAAIAMILVSLYHIYYIAFTKRGRELVKDLFPNLKDLTDAIGVAKFNLGISKVKPKLDRFSYVEKAEYWALVWGTIVMSVTGLLMWIYIDYIGVFSKIDWDIARTIHYYEAWLAFLAIVIWHFYFVIFNPDIYPMSLAWFKGTVTEEEMAEEHPLELERIKKQQAEERRKSEEKSDEV